MNIGDLWFALRGDGSGLTVDATKAAEAAGLAGGKSLSANLRKAAGPAIGAALGAAFGIASTGALKLNAAVAEFTAQTGLAGAEAETFSKNLSTLYRSNVQDYEEISATLIALRQHFGLSGQAAEDAGAAFLDFARIAGTDAATAAGNFDELVDAGVISIDEMAAFMDQLTVSHQKFGVPIQGTIDALVKFAPAMTAAGISTEEALGYINLFSEMGLNAETATKAFNLALGKVKSPEELQGLIEDISNTEDPFLRAQKAADLFGKRAGVQLANALKPGSGGIGAWRVSVEEATGATKAAGDALDSSFGAQFKILLKNAGGALAEFGTSFGPLLYVAAAAGPKFVGAITTALGGLAGIFGPKLLALLLPPGIAAGAAAGTATGGAFLAALGAAVPFLGVAAIIATLGVGIAAGIDKAVPGLARSMYVGWNEGVAMAGRWIATGRAWEPVTRAAAAGAADAMAGTFRGAGAAAATGLQDGLLGGTPGVREAGAALAREADRGIAAAAEAATLTHDELDKLARAFADTARAARDNNLDEAYDLSTIDDKIILAKAEVVAARKTLEEAVGAEQHAAARIRLAAARQELIDLRNTLRDMKQDLGAVGFELGKALGQSLHAQVVAWNQLTTAELAALGQVTINPRYGPAPTRMAGGGDVYAGMPYIVGDAGRPELFVPEVNGRIEPSVPAGGLAGGGISMGNVIINAGSFAGSESEARSFARSLFDRIEDEAHRRGLRLATA